MNINQSDGISVRILKLSAIMKSCVLCSSAQCMKPFDTAPPTCRIIYLLNGWVINKKRCNRCNHPTQIQHKSTATIFHSQQHTRDISTNNVQSFFRASSSLLRALRGLMKMFNILLHAGCMEAARFGGESRQAATKGKFYPKVGCKVMVLQNSFVV